MIYLTAIGQPPGGSSTVHIYTQTIQRTTQNKQYIQQHRNQEECGLCPVFAGFTLAFVLQLRKKHGKTSVRVAIHKRTIRIHSCNNLTAIGQPPSGSSTVHIYMQTIQRKTQNKRYIQHGNQEECGPCPVFAGFTLAFALQLREKNGKTSVRVVIQYSSHIYLLAEDLIRMSVAQTILQQMVGEW